jgi:hypothetical protein
LEALLPQTVIDEARSDYDKARKLTNRWNHALAALMELRQAFQVEFDPKTYPEELRPSSKARKPRGYFERLLAAKITIHPPAPIPELLATKTKPKSTQPKLKHSKRIELTGTQLRNAGKPRAGAKLNWLDG